MYPDNETIFIETKFYSYLSFIQVNTGDVWFKAGDHLEHHTLNQYYTKIDCWISHTQT